MKKNWYEIKRNNPLGYKMMLFMLRFFPPKLMRFFAFPIGFFYWIFAKSARHFSAQFFGAIGKKPRTLSHIISFALNLVENVQAWAGKIEFEQISFQNDDISFLISNIDSKKGALIMISHLGNAQMLKALATLGKSGTARKMSVTTIMDTDLFAGFNKMIKKVNGDSDARIVNANNIGPETAILLQERLDSGEIVVIAGDRVGSHSERKIKLGIFNRNANFPYGVFLLASLLKVPVYFVNGIRENDLSIGAKYKMFVKKSRVDFDCPRKEREGKIIALAEEYAQNLEKLALENPLQWYNFFDFFAE